MWFLIGAVALLLALISFKFVCAIKDLSSQVLWAAVMAEITFLELLIDLEQYGTFEKPLLLHSQITDFSAITPTVSVESFDPRFTASARFALSKWYLPRPWRKSLAELFATTCDIHEFGQQVSAADVYSSAINGLQLSKNLQRIFKEGRVERAKKKAEALPVHGMLKMSLKHFATHPTLSTSQIGHC